MTKCKECGKQAAYVSIDIEASKGQDFYVKGAYCDAHGPLPLIPVPATPSAPKHICCYFPESRCPVLWPFAKETNTLQTALRDIANHAGAPTMSYCPEVERREQREILDWIANRAAEALKEKS